MASPKKADCSPEQWAKHLAKAKAYRDANRERERERDRARYRRDAEKIKQRVGAYGAKPTTLERRRNSARMKRSGVTPEMFRLLFERQGGACAVCRRPIHFGGPKTHADHCHATGRPRGLLCHPCNVVEGLIRKVGVRPVEFGQVLQRYLDSPPAAEFV